MRTKKKFDCVQMKRDIQAKILAETKGMNESEIREYRRRRIESNPILRDFVERVQNRRSRIEAKQWEKVEQRGAVIRDLKLSLNEKLLLFTLNSFVESVESVDYIEASYKDLADGASLSRRQTINILNSLCARGIIQKSRGRRCNVWKFNLSIDVQMN